ncbi:MAG: YcxB family protein [Blastocatellia bacterium]
MTIHFFLNWEEYFAAQEFFRRRGSKLAPEYLLGSALLAAGMVLLFMGDRGIFAATVLILGLVVIFAAPFLRRWASRRKWFREPLYHTEHTVAASDDGVYFQMGKIESNLVWHYYQRLVESPEGFLLVYGGESFNYLPKRAFTGDEMIAQFRDLAASKLSYRG